MKKIAVFAFALLMILPILAQAPQGAMVWRSADLKAYATSLAPKLDSHHLASQALGNFGFYNALVVHREGTGEAEYHETSADVMFVESGECSMILGGTIKDGKPSGAGEIRGTVIEDGKTYQLAAGDIVHVPPKTPHQVVIAAGGQITYVVFKENAH